MFKKISAVLLTATVGLTAVAVLAPVSTSVASAATASGLYKLVTIDNADPNTMYMAENSMGYAAQTRMASVLKDASVIDAGGNWSAQEDPANGCAIISGGLQCWGNQNSSGQLGDETFNVPANINTLVTATRNSIPITNVTSISRYMDITCITSSGELLCAGAGVNLDSSASWASLLNGVKKVKITWDSICALMNDGTVKCSARYTQPDGRTWTDVGATGATDIDFGSNRFCVAGTAPMCFQTSNGAITTYTVTGISNSTRVYAIPNYSDSFCFHDGSILFCGGLVNGEYKMREAAVMEAPLSIVYAAFNNGPSSAYLVMPTGLLSFNAWNFSCTTCGYSNSGFLPLKKFTASTQTSYNSLVSINGATNSPYFIPMTVETGTRSTRSLVPVRLVTEGGEPIANSSIRWSAPDFPGTLGSSTSSTLTTDATGNARTTLSTGPVTFTLSGGAIASGTTLHAASITVNAASSGTVTVSVPNPPPVVDRTVRVVMPDGGVVPSATVSIRNNFLAFAYQNSGNSSSTWSSQPGNSYFQIAQCIYCYAQPPVYLTGENGSVTFKSFNPNRRNGSFDASVRYDDGDLNQVVQATFSSLNHTVSMPFMARVSTPVRDTNPATPEIEIEVKNGGIDIDIDITDDANQPVSSFVANAEPVCPVLQTGGVVPEGTTAATVATTLCATTAFPGMMPPPSPMVRPFAACISRPASTNASGRGTVRVCANSSQLYRVRGKGALPSRTFCAVVNGKACVTANSASTTTGLNKVFKLGKKISLKSAGVSVAKGAKVKITISKKSQKICTVDKTNNFIGLKNGTCSASVRVETKSGSKKKVKTHKVSFTVQTATNQTPLAVKGSRTLAAILKNNGVYVDKGAKLSAKLTSSSKRICTLSKDKVIGRSAGTCKITIDVNRKGLPKSKETISLTVQ